MYRLAIIIFIFISIKIFSQPVPERIPVYKNGRWGFCDTSDKIIIPCIYLRVQPFVNDYALVMDTFAKWGIVNKKGIEVLSCQYDAIEGFRSGFARINMNGMYGFINTRLKEAVPMKITKNFDKPNDCLKKEGAATSGLFAFDTLGTFVTFENKYIETGDFSEGLCWVATKEKGGFINTKFEEIIPLGEFQEQGGKPLFSEGLSGVRSKGFFGYIDKTGKEIIPFKYDVGYPFSEGKAAVCMKWKWGFIDKTNQEITKSEYDYAYPFTDGMAIVVKNDKYGYVNSSGKNIIACQYHRGSDFRNGYALVSQFAKNFLINKKGQKASKEYDEISYLYNSFYLTFLNKKYGIISLDGKEILPCKYKDITWYSYQYNLGIVVGDNGKYGLINNKGQFIIPCKYDFLEIKADNLIYAESANINGNGNPVKNIFIGDKFYEKAFLQQGFFDLKGKKYF